MTEDFQFVAHEGVSVLAYQPWWREGLVHGMTCSPLSFSKEARQSSSNLLALALNVKEVIIPHQFHTNIALDLRRHLHKGYADDVASCDADALIIDRWSNADTAFGVVTADCVPIVVRSGESFALIHAGWRGLAGGIIKEACSYLPNIEQVVIFPCAGSNLYEVGAEVLEEIGFHRACIPASASVFRDHQCFDQALFRGDSDFKWVDLPIVKFYVSQLSRLGGITAMVIETCFVIG